MTREARSEERRPQTATPLRSAGGVVVQASAEGARVALMLSHYGTWVFPKGGIEAGEEPQEAARREVAEEIGLADLELRGPLGTTEHEFDRGEERCRKQVHWFLFEAPQGAEPRHSPEEHAMDAGWFDAEKALSLLSHADQRRVLRRALKSWRQ